MTKIRGKFEEWLEVVNSYGFALYRGVSDLVEGVETLVCATFWFSTLMVLFAVDFVLCIFGILIDTIIKGLEALIKVTG